MIGDASLTGGELLAARLDAIKIASGVAVSGGGILGIYLAIRRQRATELDLRLRDRTQSHNEQVAHDNRVHQERLASASESDAQQRRITELYTKSVEQLGAAQAPVRLGALYALERLAQENSEHRQTVVNVLSAYLRMPFKVPRSRLPAGVVGNPNQSNDEGANVENSSLQELQVRNTAQRILQVHFRATEGINSDIANPQFWGPDLDVDLSGSTLIDANFANCQARNIILRECYLIGNSRFSYSTFTGRIAFDKSIFTGGVDFRGTNFRGGDGNIDYRFTSFSDCLFAGEVSFDDTTHGFFECEDASFDSKVSFTGLRTFSSAYFARTVFSKEAFFMRVTFGGKVEFEDADFRGEVRITDAVFHSSVSLGAAAFAASPDLARSATAIDRQFKTERYVHNYEIKSQWPSGWQLASWPTYKSAPSEDATWRILVPSEDAN